MASPLDELNKMNDICLFVDDFDRALHFFTEVFGFRVKRLQPSPEHANYAEFDFRSASVTIWERTAVERDAIPAEFLGPAGHHFMIAIRVPTVEDVTAIFNELKARGASVVREPVDYEFGSRACYLLDCEGNIWEVFAWFEGDGPGLLDVPETAVTTPASSEANDS